MFLAGNRASIFAHYGCQDWELKPSDALSTARITVSMAISIFNLRLTYHTLQNCPNTRHQDTNKDQMCTTTASLTPQPSITAALTSFVFFGPPVSRAMQYRVFSAKYLA